LSDETRCLTHTSLYVCTPSKALRCGIQARRDVCCVYTIHLSEPIISSRINAGSEPRISTNGRATRTLSRC
jgi:hypothetical protein